jgi:hypothetical protein
VNDERRLEILGCFDDTLWTPFYEVRSSASHYANVRPPTVHELQALKREGLLTYRPPAGARLGVVGPGVWAMTAEGCGLKYGDDPANHVTVPAAEHRWS